MQFCSIPPDRANQKIFWSPLYAKNAENPWGVTIMNIRVDPKKKSSKPKMRCKVSNS